MAWNNHLFLPVLLFIFIISVLPAQDIQQIMKMPVVYQVPGMDKVQLHKDITYKKMAEKELKMDIYVPATAGKNKRVPAIIFVHGGPAPPGLVSLPPKDWGVFTSYGRLAAASGMAGITFNHRHHGLTKEMLESSFADVKDAIEFINKMAESFKIDKSKLCLWAFSGGGCHLSIPLRQKMKNIRCLVSYYAVMNLKYFISPAPKKELAAFLDQLAPIQYIKENDFPFPPILIARAGMDMPAIHRSIKEFTDQAIEANILIELLNHPKGRHGFDVLNNEARSRAIIARTLEFIKEQME
jgi:acetyl esterase/lipase